MQDVFFTLESKIEVLESKLLKTSEELAKYKLIEHANCGCTNFCYEKENSKDAREMYDDLYERYINLKDENKLLKEEIQRLRNGI